MQVDIIAIGNSRGIRIPKALLEQCAFGKSVEITIENKQLILKKPAKPKKSTPKKLREGWAESARRMAALGEDALLMDDFRNAFDEEEWEW